MRVLVCGDRNWSNKNKIREILSHLISTDSLEVVIEGGARGADRLAGEVAKELKIPVEEYPANWARFGRAAGPIRNKQMLDEGEPDLILAFHSNIETSKGTRNMVEQSKALGLKVRIIKDS